MVQTVSYGVEAACSGSVPAKLWLAWQTASPAPSLLQTDTSLVFVHFTRCLHNLKSRTPKHCPSLDTAASAPIASLNRSSICKLDRMEADIVASNLEGNEIDQDMALQVRPGQNYAVTPSDALQVGDDCRLLQANPTHDLFSTGSSGWCRHDFRARDQSQGRGKTCPLSPTAVDCGRCDNAKADDITPSLEAFSFPPPAPGGPEPSLPLPSNLQDEDNSDDLGRNALLQPATAPDHTYQQTDTSRNFANFLLYFRVQHSSRPPSAESL